MPAFSINFELGQVSLAQVPVGINAEKPYLSIDDPGYDAKIGIQLVQQPNPHMLTLQKLVSSCNLFIQIICGIYILSKKLLKKGPFYTILLVFSITVAFRIIVDISSLSLTIIIQEEESRVKIYSILSSLYIDYCSNLFSVTITFFLSLNRCLNFTSKKWNGAIFESNRLGLTITSSATISILGALGIIVTSTVTREYFPNYGFLDRSPDEGFKVSINRFFNLFPFGSIICYLFLYRYLYTLNQKTTTPTVFLRKGKQQVFSQMIIISVLYIIMNLVYEAITLTTWDTATRNYIPWIQALSIANHLPEISLPFLFLLDAFKIRKNLMNWLTGRGDVRQVTVAMTVAV